MGNYIFHLEQGEALLNSTEPTADKVKEAMNHFVIANQKIDYENDEYGKPRSLYYLSLGNLIIRNIKLSYKLAHKANRKIDDLIKNAPIQTNNFRERLGGNDIDYIINHIEENFNQEINSVNFKKDKFNENELDFSNF